MFYTKAFQDFCYTYLQYFLWLCIKITCGDWNTVGFSGMAFSVSRVDLHPFWSRCTLLGYRFLPYHQSLVWNDLLYFTDFKQKLVKYTYTFKFVSKTKSECFCISRHKLLTIKLSIILQFSDKKHKTDTLLTHNTIIISCLSIYKGNKSCVTQTNYLQV